MNLRLFLATCLAVLGTVWLAPPTAHAAGTLSGVVTSDATGLPVADVEVTLGLFQTGASTTTDGSGAYEFTGLDAGDYFVSFSPPTREHRFEFWNDQPSFATANAIAVADGGTTVANVGLDRRVRLSGTVTSSDGGTPLEGVDIWFQRIGDSATTRDTAADGTFELWAEPVQYQVQYRDFGDTHEWEWWDDRQGTETPDVIDLSDGVDRVIDAELFKFNEISGVVTSETDGMGIGGILVRAGSESTNTAPDGSYSMLVPPSVVSVQFLDLTNRYVSEWWDDTTVFGEATQIDTAISGATADAVLTERALITGSVSDGGSGIEGVQVRGCPIQPRSACQYTTTDTNGDYDLYVPEADVEVRFDGTAVGYEQLYYDGETQSEDATLVSTTVGSPQSGINASLGEAATISGTVFDPSGAPLQWATVQACGIDALLSNCDPSFNTTSASDGSYTLTVTPGRYRVSFFASGYPIGNHPSTLDLAPNDVVDPLDWQFVEWASLTGTVVDENGVGIDDVTVIIRSEFADWARQETTASDGTYLFDEAPPADDYIIEFTTPHYSDEFYDEATSAETATPITLDPGATTVIDEELAGGGAITGTVTNNSDVALEGIEVRACITSNSCGSSTLTAADGTYRIGGLATGSYEVRFADPTDTYASESFDGALSWGYTKTLVAVTFGVETYDVDADLELDAEVSGVITDANGPIADATATLCDVPQTGCRLATADAGGEYSIRDLLPGDYTISYRGPDSSVHVREWWQDVQRSDDAAPITIEAGDDLTLDVDMSLWATLEGLVTNATGGPIDNANVSACNAAGDKCWSSTTEADGTFSLPVWPGDGYSLRFSSNGFADEWWCDAELEDDALRFDVADGATIDGFSASLRLDADADHDTCNQDGDDLLDPVDNCPNVANNDQADNEADGVGDACDPDDDNDTVDDLTDNCPNTANNDQANNDGDADGDACDPDDDNDTVLDVADNCQFIANDAQHDNDADGDGDQCDPDDDNDNVSDLSDNCPIISNSDQADLDSDGAGDACDDTDDRAVFEPLGPARFADSRAEPTFDGQFQNTGIREGGSTWEVQIAGRGGVPANATAAVLNVTTAGGAAPGFATVHPCNDLPNASSVNYGVGTVDPNEVIAKLSPGGAVCVYVLTDVHVIIDVVGHVTNSPFEALTPTRFADSRDEPTFDDQQRNTGIRRAGSTWELPIAGRGEVPTDATAVVMNLTVTGGAAPGFATVHPCGVLPNASSLNYGPGDTRPNELIAKLSDTGALCVYVLTDVHVIIDVVGFVRDTPNFSPLTPVRFADSRNEPTFDDQERNTGIRPGGTNWEVPIAGRGDVPASATAAVINLTLTGGSEPGFATVYPCGDLPTASSLNYGPGTTRPNELLAKFSDSGTVCVYTFTDVHVIIDVTGHDGT